LAWSYVSFDVLCVGNLAADFHRHPLDAIEAVLRNGPAEVDHIVASDDSVRSHGQYVQRALARCSTDRNLAALSPADARSAHLG
jgi:hypothetical protein